MNFLDVVAKYAPAVVGALGGPIGVLGGAAVSILADQFGTPKTRDAVEKVLTSIGPHPTPEQIAKLQAAEAAMAVELLRHTERMEELYSADRANARIREIQTKDWFPKFLAVVVMLAFIGSVAGLWVVPMVDGTRDLVMISIGVINSAFTGVVAYYLGSSAGSKINGEAVRNELAKR